MINLFDYPTNEDLQERKQEKLDHPIVHVRQGIQMRQNMRPFFNKSTFSFDKMFVTVNDSPLPSLRQQTIQLSSATQGQFKSTRVHEHEDEDMLQSRFNHEQKSKQKPKNCAKSQDKLCLNSDFASDSLNLENIDKAYSFSEPLSDVSQKSQHQNEIEQSNSRLSGLNQVFDIGKQQDFNLESEDEGEDDWLKQYSSILSNSALYKEENEKKSFILMLNKSQENGSEIFLKREDKIKQLSHEPFQKVIFQVVAKNCKKISLKVIDDGLGFKDKLRRLIHPQLLSIVQKTIKLNQNSTTRWYVAKSKTKIEPFLVLTFCVCNFKKIIQIENEASIFCDKCGKQIEICFQITQQRIDIGNCGGEQEIIQ